jgi:hypothetical protein
MSSKVPLPEPEAIEVKLPQKAKKERTQAQKEAAMKGMAALKAKREAAAAAEKDSNDAKVIAKEKVRNAKKANPGTDLATKKELQEFMENVKTLIAKPAIAEKPQKPKPATPSESEEDEPPPVKVKKPKAKAAPPVAPPVTQQVPQQVIKLSGHALLDSIFFNH